MKNSPDRGGISDCWISGTKVSQNKFITIKKGSIIVQDTPNTSIWKQLRNRNTFTHI